MKLPSQVNKARQQFIDHATIGKVIDAAPDHDWRCIIALARFGGLRTPSETLTLKWTDVDWDRGRVTIRSPKLEHFTSGGIRQIPLFAELRQHLEAAFETAPDGAVFVVNRYRASDANLRTTFLKIIDRAGVKPWGRLFHNLRSSRQTELQESFPSHVVAAWMGNSPRTADAHYNQVRESDFEKAAGSALHWALHHPEVSGCPTLSGRIGG